LNDVQLGYSRDREILARVERHKALDTDQIASLLFREIKTGQRKAQERLQKLVKARALNRSRLSNNEPYVYFTGRQSGRQAHQVAVNWVYVWLLSTLKSWERFVAWETEQDYGTLQADGFFAVKNTTTGKHRLIFVELDRSDNEWDKTAKYNALYKSGRYADRWWMQLTDRFPTILCVTTTANRAKMIKQSIASENTHGLRFEVKLLDQIKKEAIPWQVR
jgi:hypothetical protein